MWCQIIIFDSQSNANLSVKNFYLDLDGRHQTCSEGQTWLQKSRWIKTISFFGKFGQTKIRRRVRSKFLLPEFFSTKLKLSFETLMEEIKLVVTHQYEFEYWDGIKLRAPTEISDSEPCDSKKTKVAFLNETFSHNLKNRDWGLGGRKNNLQWRTNMRSNIEKKNLLHFWEIPSISILI